MLLNRCRRVPIPWKQQFVMCLSGLRGAVAFALATTFSSNRTSVVTLTRKCLSINYVIPKGRSQTNKFLLIL
jgi:NhaP-type Na+/H+ or K+/H+ antiporter